MDYFAGLDVSVKVTSGFLGANPSIESSRVAAFVQRLRELGWIDGRNLAIEYRWAGGRNERYAENAAELVRLKVDVIVTSATPPTVAAKQATAVIPIVFAAVTDPVGAGGGGARRGGRRSRARGRAPPPWKPRH